MEPHEAVAYGLTPETLVWTEGMKDWMPAGRIAEFAPYLPPQTPYQGNNVGGYGNPGYPNTPYQPGGMMPPCPSTHLVLAILVTLFCCLPFGIVSIVYSSKVEGCYNSGNFLLAQQNSDKAKKWALIGIISSLCVYVLYFALYMFGFLTLMNM